MSEALFPLPMEQLCANFVRARFAQADVFGREDIEDWLKKQEVAEFPFGLTHWPVPQHEFDTTSPASPQLLEWKPFSFPIYTHNLGYGLKDDATSFEQAPPEATDEFYAPSLFGEILTILCATKFPIYYGLRTAILQQAEDSRDRLFTMYWGKQRLCLCIARMEAEPEKFAEAEKDVLFAEWLYHRPKWENARRTLCTLADNTIANERRKAEADFDRAVAVSADGTQIVCADEVILWFPPQEKHDLIGTFSAFDPAMFSGNHRILLLQPEHLRRVDATKFNLPSAFTPMCSITNAFLWDNDMAGAERSACDRRQLIYRNRDNRLYFVTHHKFCSVVPYGGTLVER